MPRFHAAEPTTFAFDGRSCRVGHEPSRSLLSPLASLGADPLLMLGSSGFRSLYRGLCGLVVSRFLVAHRKRNHVMSLPEKYYYFGRGQSELREVKREKNTRRQQIPETGPRGRSLGFRVNERAQRVPEWGRGPLGASWITGVRGHAVRRRARPRSAGRRGTPTRSPSARIAPGRSFGGLRSGRPIPH